MVEAEGWLDAHYPRISTKTPIGRRLSENASSNDEFDFVLRKYGEPGEELQEINVELCLKIDSITNDAIKLEQLPKYLKPQIGARSEYVIYDIKNLLTDEGPMVTDTSSDEQLTELEIDGKIHNIEQVNPIKGKAYLEIPRNSTIEEAAMAILNYIGYETDAEERSNISDNEFAAVGHHPEIEFQVGISCEYLNETINEKEAAEIKAKRTRYAESAPSSVSIFIIGGVGNINEEELNQMAISLIPLGTVDRDDAMTNLYKDLQAEIPQSIMQAILCQSN